MKLLDEVPVDTGASDVAFDTRPDFEAYLDDFFLSFFFFFLSSLEITHTCSIYEHEGDGTNIEAIDVLVISLRFTGWHISSHAVCVGFRTTLENKKFVEVFGI